MKNALNATVGHMNTNLLTFWEIKTGRKNFLSIALPAYPAQFFIYVNAFCDFFVVLSAKYKLFDNKRNTNILKELKNTNTLGKN